VTKVLDHSFQSVPLQALPVKEHDHAIHKEAPSLEANEKMEDNNSEYASSCNMENARMKIKIPSQNNNNDENDLSAKALLCLAWQIAQGMVSRNCGNSPENLKLADTMEPS